jgi:hypothetical protein
VIVNRLLFDQRSFVLNTHHDELDIGHGCLNTGHNKFGTTQKSLGTVSCALKTHTWPGMLWGITPNVLFKTLLYELKAGRLDTRVTDVDSGEGLGDSVRKKPAT